jgi:hypothetical protein
MSAVYIQRLRQVRDEYDAAREALAFVLTNWYKQDVQGATGSIARRDFERAAHNLEMTFFVRLFAEFEGILKDHLSSKHIFVPKDPKVDWLISCVLRAESLKIDSELRKRLEDVRTYRNSIAHSSAAPVVITFKEALARMNKFLDKLADPPS